MREAGICFLVVDTHGSAWLGLVYPVSQEQANAAISRNLPFVQLGLRCDQLFGVGIDFCVRKQRRISRADIEMHSCRQSCDRGLLSVLKQREVHTTFNCSCGRLTHQTLSYQDDHPEVATHLALAQL